MVNPIRFILGDKIIYVIIVDNGVDIVGLLKYELTEDMLLIHPTLYNPNKTKFKLFKVECFKSFKYFKEEYNYKAVHACTDNNKLIDMITNKEAYIIGNGEGGVLYEYVI